MLGSWAKACRTSGMTKYELRRARTELKRLDYFEKNVNWGAQSVWMRRQIELRFGMNVNELREVVRDAGKQVG